VKTQFGKLILESKVCVLCGEQPPSTKEHIPPRGLFLTLPREYLAVPSCDLCNNSTKLDDEYLRQVMSAAALSQTGMDVWRNKVAPKLSSHPKTRAGLRDRLSVASLTVPSLGKVSLPTMSIDRKRMNTSLRKLVSGLYWFHSGTVLPSDTQLKVIFVSVAELPSHFEDAEKIAIFRKTKPGVYTDPEVMKTFFYYFAIAGANSLWYFFFYKQNVFIVAAVEPEKTEPPRSDETT